MPSEPPPPQRQPKAPGRRSALDRPIRFLAELAQARSFDHARQLIRTAWTLGARLGLTWKSTDFHTDELYKAARDLWQDSRGLILTAKYGTPIDPGNLTRILALRAHRAGLRVIPLRNTRHTRSSLIVALKVPARKTQRPRIAPGPLTCVHSAGPAFMVVRLAGPSPLGVPSERRGTPLDETETERGRLMASQVITLVGVLLGAMTSFFATSLAERAKFRQTLATRWDERELDTYIEYL